MLKHRQPVGVAGLGTGRFERLVGGGDEPDFVELGLLAAAISQQQVPFVNRIEATAKDAKTHKRNRSWELRGWGLGEWAVGRVDCTIPSNNLLPLAPKSQFLAPSYVFPAAKLVRHRTA